MLNKITRDFYDEVMSCRDLQQYIKDNEEHFISINLPNYLDLLIKDKNTTKKELIKSTGIEKSYLYQIFNGRRRPSRDKLLRIALALKLSLENTQKMLIVSENPILFPARKRDAVLICCITGCESIHQVQITLYDMGLDILD